MEQSPYWYINTDSASQETLKMLWDPNVHYPFHNSPALIPALDQINPVHIVIS
jgi:hypothetical protein